MKNHLIQLIPDLVSLETNVEKINCFSFWDNPARADFFDPSKKSSIQLKYFVHDLEIPLEKPSLKFSNFNYLSKKWYYDNQKSFLRFSLSVDEKKEEITVNPIYHRLFIKIGWLQPAGYLLTDYLTYRLEKENLFYQVGAAAKFKGKTTIFYGFGKNFKTTLMGMLVSHGGSYIGEEFILLHNDRVYATIPNAHPFDFRPSHHDLMSYDLKKNKVDSSEYNHCIFLVLSNKNKVIELNIDQANRYAEHYQNTYNTYFYHDLVARDYLENNTSMKKKVLTNRKAKYFVIFFSDVSFVYDFVSKL